MLGFPNKKPKTPLKEGGEEVPIAIAPIEQELRIVKVLADEKTKKHLESLGIVIQGSIRILSSSGGNVICLVKGVRLALNRDVATKILVA